MAYTVERKTTVDATILRRLFDASEAKINEGTITIEGATTSDEKFAKLKDWAEIWAANGMLLECKKDSYVVFMSWGSVENKVWKVVNFLAGQDNSGSRSYLYDPEWIVAMRDFHLSMSDVYTSQEHIHVRGQSAVNHYNTMMSVADSDERFTHTKETVVQDGTYSNSKISEIS